MKIKIVLIFTYLCLSAVLSKAQDTSLIKFPIDSITHKISYIGIVDIKNDRDQLFKNAQAWVTEQFGDYKKVVQLGDKDNGRIIIKGTVKDVTTKSDLSFTFIIEVKANKYRYTINDLSYSSFYGYPTPSFFTQTLDNFLALYEKAKPNSSLKKRRGADLISYKLIITELINSLHKVMLVNDSF